MVDALRLALPFAEATVRQWWRPRLSAGLATLGAMLETGLTDRAARGRNLDELTLAVARERSRPAFGALFGHFAPRIKSYLMRLGTDPGQAEELAQEVMLLVWHRAETFDPTQASASTWVFTIARNKRIDAIRRERRPEFDPNDPALVPQPVEAADRAVEAGQETARLRAAIGALPEEQAELLRLAYFDDKPHSAISAERGIPLGTVKSRLRLALERLRRLLKEPV
jgi:RNA polymerase sigma-70 factor (ECF subfamily)